MLYRRGDGCEGGAAVQAAEGVGALVLARAGYTLILAPSACPELALLLFVKSPAAACLTAGHVRVLGLQQ